MNNVLQLFLTLLFDSYHPILIVFRCLYILGAWILLTKSGLKGFWALIPWAREYQLSRCASREPEGRVYCLISALITLLSVANICFRWNRGSVTLNTFSPLILVSLISVMIMHFVYNIRIFSGFIEVYDVSKAWLILCIIDELRFIPMLIWGWGKKYKPQWKGGD